MVQANSGGAAGSVASITSAKLTVRVFDVDFNCARGDCERDEVFLKGTRLTNPEPYLTGANESWSIRSFTVDPSIVREGANEVRIVIDVLGAGWCLEADFGQLEVTRSDGSQQTFRTGEGSDLDLYQPCDGGDNLIAFEIDVYDVDVKQNLFVRRRRHPGN